MPRLSLLLVLAVCALLAPTTSLAMDEATVVNCADGRACADHKLDFGASAITCFDKNGMQTAKWACEYSYKNICKSEETNVTINGGYLPIQSDMCTHLCGKCESGWN